MILATDQSAFDALHPFSFITDEKGEILTAGRTLAKLCPEAKIGRLVRDHFAITQPSGVTTCLQPEALVGELLILEYTAHREIRFRGHVVATHAQPATYIFSIKPLIADVNDIPRLGLTIADFEMVDPIFDFMMYMQGQIKYQQKLREAKALAEWETLISKLLLDISLTSESCQTEHDVYRSTISSVCKALNWDFGHVYVVKNGTTTRLISGNICTNRAPDRLGDFERLSKAIAFAPGEGLPGKVWQQQEVVWIKDAQRDLSLPRRSSVLHLPNLTGVGLPIFAGEQVIAVLEFFTERSISDSENMRRFFRLLSAQLGGTIARQRAEHAARHHLAGLANASKMATLGEMAAGVAHEINNPLHTLTLTTHLLKKLIESNKLIPEVLTGQLTKMETSIHRMATIVGALKSFSRDSSHDSFQGTSLKRILQETLELSDATLTGHKVEISISTIPDSWIVECRPSQISQVILNLVNNACDAIGDQPHRWIRIDVSDEGGFFQIAVTDSGPPIPPEVAAKIMTPFFTTKPPGKGTGLGLSISSSILSDHGGGLSLDTGSQHTRFVVTLPKHRPNSFPDDHSIKGMEKAA